MYYYNIIDVFGVIEMQNRQYLMLPKWPQKISPEFQSGFGEGGGKNICGAFRQFYHVAISLQRNFFRGRMVTTRHLIAVKLE